jgi:hypothetical protein
MTLSIEKKEEGRRQGRGTRVGGGGGGCWTATEKGNDGKTRVSRDVKADTKQDACVHRITRRG